MRVTLRQAVLIANKDFRIFLADRFAMAFSLAFPLMFVLGFTLALSNLGQDDERLTLTLATREESGLSRGVIESMIAASEGGMEQMEYEQALSAVEDGALDGFVAFPEDFTESMGSGGSTSLEVVTHADEPFTAAALAGLARSISSRAVAAQAAWAAVKRLQESDEDGASVDFTVFEATPEPLISFETDMVGEIKPFKASNFTLPAYLTMFVFFAAVMGAASLAKERSNQTLERLLSNGARRSALVLGKYLALVYVGMMQLVVLWTVGLLGFGIDLGHAPAAVIAISVILALTSAGFAVLMASLIRTEGAATSGGILVSMMLAPIGGCWWPLFVVPQWLQTLAYLTPHGWANSGFNKLMLFGADFGDVQLEAGALAAMGAVFLLAALWRFRSTV